MRFTQRNFPVAITVLLCVSAPLWAKNPEVKRISFDDLKLGLQPDEKYVAEKHLTDKVESLAGQTVRVRGWIHPSVPISKGIKQFVLVRDNQECCFGTGAALHDCIVVEMEPGTSTKFTSQPIAVEGVFELHEVPGGPNGRQLAIYRLKATSAK